MTVFNMPMKLAGALVALSFMEDYANWISEQYELPDPHHLKKILEVIHFFRSIHEDVKRDDHETRAKVKRIQARYRKLKQEAEAILAADDGNRVGGTLLAALSEEETNIFDAQEIYFLLVRLVPLKKGSFREPASNALRGFIIPLGEYWFHCTGEHPSGMFEDAQTGFAPVPQTAAAFIVDCLRATGWQYSNEAVAEQFAAIDWASHLPPLDDVTVH